MFSPVQLPPQPQPRRQNRARHYAHRVRESLTSRIGKLVCSIVLTLVLIAGVLIFVLWLSLRPHRPRFHLTSFSVPGLSLSSITFDVSIRNPNGNIGINYDSMTAAVYYREQPVGSAPVMVAFYQPPKNTTVVHGVVEAATTATTTAEVGGGRVAFRLDLTSEIRFRLSTWDTHRHGLHVSCDVEVGPDGVMLAEYKDRRCSIYF